MPRNKSFLAVFALTVACSSGSNTQSGNDAAVDGAPDGAVEVDATPDVGPDATPDVGPDATPDVGPDATPDVGPDATPDAGPDATPDVAPDAAPDVALDVAADAASDAALDASADVPRDASTDAALDASTDAPRDVAADTAMDVAADARSDAAPDLATDAAPDASGSARELWILRVGEGMAALTNASTALFIERRSAGDGATRGAAFPLPVAMAGANRPVTLSGTATSEGALTRSVDGRYVTLAGYGAAPGMASIASSTLERVVARVAADGAVDSTTGLGMAYSANNVRAAVTVDGSAFWVAGTGTVAGVQYKMRGAAGEPVNVIAMPANVRAVNVFGTQLYASASTGTPAPGFYGVFSAGMGTPTTAGATATMLPGFPAASGPSPYGFAALDRDAAVVGVDTLYVCDDRSIASGGGVQRWTRAASGEWTLGATLAEGVTSGCRGLTAWLEGTDAFVAAVTAENPSRVVVYRDRAGAPAAAPTVIATAPMNTQFRGVALAPQM